MLRKLALLFAILILFLSVFTFNTHAEEKANIYYIENFEDLIAMENNPFGTYYLKNDILADETIGMLFSNKEMPFSGMLDGQGYSIVGLSVLEETGAAAFIGNLNGTIRSVNFINARIETVDGSLAGGIVYKNNGVIENCDFDGVVIADGTIIQDTEIAAFDYGDIVGCNVNKKDETSSNTVTSNFEIDETLTSEQASSENKPTSEVSLNAYASEKVTTSQTGSNFVSSKTASVFEITYSITQSIVSEESSSETYNDKETSSKTKSSSKVKSSSSKSSSRKSSSSSRITSSKNTTSSKTSSSKYSSKSSKIKTSTSSKTSSVKSSKISTSKPTKQSSSRVTTSYGDRTELKDYFETSSSQSGGDNLPAAVMLGLCGLALILMFGFVIYKEITEKKDKK